MNRLKKITIELVSLIMKAIRPLLGYPNVCLYPVNCMIYAESMLRSRPWIYALPSIGLRLLSCNPLSGILILTWHRFHKTTHDSLPPHF